MTGINPYSFLNTSEFTERSMQEIARLEENIRGMQERFYQMPLGFVEDLDLYHRLFSEAQQLRQSLSALPADSIAASAARISDAEGRMRQIFLQRTSSSALANVDGIGAARRLGRFELIELAFQSHIALDESNARSLVSTLMHSNHLSIVRTLIASYPEYRAALLNAAVDASCELRNRELLAEFIAQARQTDGFHWRTLTFALGSLDLLEDIIQADLPFYPGARSHLRHALFQDDRLIIENRLSLLNFVYSLNDAMRPYDRHFPLAASLQRSEVLQLLLSRRPITRGLRDLCITKAYCLGLHQNVTLLQAATLYPSNILYSTTTNHPSPRVALPFSTPSSVEAVSNLISSVSPAMISMDLRSNTLERGPSIRAASSARFSHPLEPPLVVSMARLAQDPMHYLQILVSKGIPSRIQFEDSLSSIDHGGLSKEFYQALIAALRRNRMLELSELGLLCHVRDERLMKNLGALYSALVERNASCSDPFLTGECLGRSFFALLKIIVGQNPETLQRAISSWLATIELDPLRRQLHDLFLNQTPGQFEKYQEFLHERIGMKEARCLQEVIDEYREFIVATLLPAQRFLEGASAGFISQIKQLEPIALCTSIEGRGVDVDDVIHSLVIAPSTSSLLEHLVEQIKTFLRQASDDELRKFLMLVTGRNCLPPGAFCIKIQIAHGEDNAVFRAQSCTNTLYLPSLTLGDDTFISLLKDFVQECCSRYNTL